MDVQVPSAQTTLLILLGASAWPLSPEFQSSEAFSNAARRVRAYFLNPRPFGLPAENLLDLFDSDKSSDELDVAIGQFLEQRIAALKKMGNPARDLLLYFVGHGGFVGRDADFYLAIRRTRMENPRASGLHVMALADTLTERARHLRRMIILDCCFAAAAFSAFQAGPDQVALEKTVDAFKVNQQAVGFPTKGTTLLCSSSHKSPSLLLPDGTSTMFTKAFLDTLIQGITVQRDRLSLRDVKDAATDLLYGIRNAPMPVVLSPDQSEGDVADIPFFPNSWIEKQRLQRIEEERRRQAEETRKVEEEQQRNAEEERVRRAEEEERRRRAEEEAWLQKAEEDRLRKVEEEKQRLQRIEEERRRQAEETRKAEEEQQRAENAKAPSRSSLYFATSTSPSQPRMVINQSTRQATSSALSWWLLGARGLLAVLFGLAALVMVANTPPEPMDSSWNNPQNLVMAATAPSTLFPLFGIYTLLSGAIAVIISLQEYGISKIWRVTLVEGVFNIGIAVYVYTFFWQSADESYLRTYYQIQAAVQLGLLITIWAIIIGILTSVAAFSSQASFSRGWAVASAGILSILSGIIIFMMSNWYIGRMWLIGIYSITFGILYIVRAFQLKKAGL